MSGWVAASAGWLTEIQNVTVPEPKHGCMAQTLIFIRGFLLIISKTVCSNKQINTQGEKH